MVMTTRFLLTARPTPDTRRPAARNACESRLSRSRVASSRASVCCVRIPTRRPGSGRSCSSLDRWPWRSSVNPTCTNPSAMNAPANDSGCRLPYAETVDTVSRTKRRRSAGFIGRYPQSALENSPDYLMRGASRLSAGPAQSSHAPASGIGSRPKTQSGR